MRSEHRDGGSDGITAENGDQRWGKKEGGGKNQERKMISHSLEGIFRDKKIISDINLSLKPSLILLAKEALLLIPLLKVFQFLMTKNIFIVIIIEKN